MKVFPVTAWIKLAKGYRRRGCLMALLILLMSNFAQGQVSVVRGKGKLRKDYWKVDWYLDTLKHEASELILGPCGGFRYKHASIMSISQHENNVVLYNGRRYLCFGGGKVHHFVAEGIGYEYHDTLLWVWSAHHLEAWGPTTDNPLHLLSSDDGNHKHLYEDLDCLPHEVQGMHAFCLPLFFCASPKPLFYLELEDLHDWGMLGVNGKWLIEPKFDAPFKFENGIAEVLHYGVKRKINEKGEFIDSQ